MLNKKGKTTILLAGATAVVMGLGVSPAFAEGSWSSSLTGARPGFNSRSWQDSHLDSVSTVVAFSGCSLPQSAGLAFNIQLRLYDEYGLLPDQSVGTISRSSCGAFNWGVQTRSDTYHWNLFALNGSTSTIHSLNVTSLTTTY